MAIGPNDLKQFVAILGRNQEISFYDTAPSDESVYDKYTKKGDTGGEQDYRSVTQVGLGPWAQTAEFGQYHKDSYEPGQERVSSWYQLTNGVQVSEQLIYYMASSSRVGKNKAQMFTDINQQFRDTYQWTIEQICALFQTSCRSTTKSGFWPGAGRDGLALVSASHTTIKSPQVTNNNAQGAMPLSELAIAEAISMMSMMRGDEGRPQGFVKSVLVVTGRYWQWRMNQISSADMQMDSMSNNKSVLTSGKSAYKTKINYLINPYLSDTDTSWLVLDENRHQLTFFEARAPFFSRDKDIATGAQIYKASAYAGIDFLSYRGVVQSAGA